MSETGFQSLAPLKLAGIPEGSQPETRHRTVNDRSKTDDEIDAMIETILQSEREGQAPATSPSNVRAIAVGTIFAVTALLALLGHGRDRNEKAARLNDVQKRNNDVDMERLRKEQPFIDAPAKVDQKMPVDDVMQNFNVRNNRGKNELINK